MYPVKLSLKNVGPYVDETICFTSAPGDVVAVVGENGAGKTMLVDSVFAALYRYFPSRDGIYKYCRGKAQVSLWFKVAGQNYQSVVNIDAKKREMEPWLFLEVEDGWQVPMTDGKTGTFDNAIEELCGSAEVALASVFASQDKAGSFAQLPKAKRKELFIDMLGLGKLQIVSDESLIREKNSKEEYGRVFDRFSLLQKTQEPKAENLEGLYRELNNTRNEISEGEASLKSATFETSLLKAKFWAAKEIEDRQFPVRKRMQSSLKEIAEVSRALQESEVQSARADYYRSLAQKYEEISGKLELHRLESSSLSAQLSNHHKQVAAHNLTLRELSGQSAIQQQSIVAGNKELARARTDSAIINKVPCHAEGECADCEFLVNAVKAQGSIGDVEEGIDNATAARLAIEQQIKDLPFPEAGNLAQIEAQLANIKARISSLEPQYVESNDARSKLVVAEAAASLIGDLKLRMDKLNRESTQAREEMEELERALVVAREAEGLFRKAEKQLGLDQEKLDGTRIHLNTLLAKVGRAELEEEQSKAAKQEMNELILVIGSLDQDRKSWALLAKAFGKTGIQSLEIDASGPVISEIVNDLLFSCFGPRFSVRFVTQVLKDDKSGYKDDFDIYVTDAVSEREGSIDDLSGGERVVVCEGVSLAIALFNRSRADVGWTTLFRDEASSAIDDRRAPLYIKMLRRAREEGHFERLFFIAHQQRVTEGADSKILIADGKISVE